MIVLDTDVLSEPIRRRPDARVLAWLTGLEEESAVTAVSVGELLTGIHALPEGRRRSGLLTSVEATLATFDGAVLPFDDAAARQYARLRRSRHAAGGPLSVEDGMTAAICHVAGARLATRDTGGFEGLGLDLIDPWH